jgi:hypothetical protein
MKDVFKSICDTNTHDSKVREDGWTASRHDKNFTYVAYNKFKYNKVIYKLIRRRNNKVDLRLYVSINNPCAKDFEDAVRKKGDKWFVDSRDCGVTKCIEISPIAENAIDLIYEELDNLYKAYNEIVVASHSDKTGDKAHSSNAKLAKSDSQSSAYIEKLEVQGLSPEYDLSWDSWDAYHEYWDKFIKNWYDGRGVADESFQHLVNSGEHETGLDMKELPEPYYGCGESAQCVIVHLNPGASTENENKKRLGTCTREDGQLIQSLAAACEFKYSTYAKKWSPLRGAFDGCNNASEVPGYDWWHSSNRIGWFKRFLGVEDLTKIFALEACPYHSKSWSSGLKRIEGHIIQKVIAPAAIVANRNRNCAVFVGSGFNEIISKIKDVEALGRWRGTRVYSLYKLKFPQENGGPFLLVINGMQGMLLPADNEVNRKIEKEIYDIVGGVGQKS